MSGQLTPDQLREKFKDVKWVMPYSRLTAVVDPKSENVLYLEEYGPKNGVFVEGWRALHYPLTSELVERSYREGSTTVVKMRQGQAKLDLRPSFSPFGISGCSVRKNDVRITFAGLGGAGVSAAYSRGMAENVISVDIHSEGGGTRIGSSTIRIKRHRMLLIGVDDTDNDEEGATYALVDTIAREACDLALSRYLSHVNVQLYPYNEHKTRNCFATVVAIVFESDRQKKLIIEHFKQQLKKYTVSEHTAMAVFEGFDLTNRFVSYTTELKFRMMHDMDELREVAEFSGVESHIITGERGLFGAIGALGYWDRPDFAAKLPNQCR